MLDREVTSAALSLEPSHGALREPILKVLNLLRSMEYQTQIPNLDGPSMQNQYQVKLWKIHEKVRRECDKHDLLLCFDLSHHLFTHRTQTISDWTRAIRISISLFKSQLVSPESMVLTMPNTIGLLNGMFSLIKYGLSDCHDGFGSYPGYSGCTDNGAYERSLGHLFYNPDGATISDYIDDLALLLTAGRLNDDSRSTIEDECSAEPDNSSITRCIQQLMITTGEFHSTSQVSKSGEDRTTGGTGGESTEPYKAIVYFYLGGESNSLWSISHLHIPAVHLRLILVQAAVTATTC